MDINPFDQASAVIHQAESLKERPDIVASLMSSDIGPDFATSVAGIERGKRFAELLPNLPDDLEVASWNKMSRGEQQMALAAGYDNGPIARAEAQIRAAQTKTSGYEDATGQAVLGAMGFAADKIGAAGNALVKQPAKKILGAFGWILHETDHAYRSGSMHAPNLPGPLDEFIPVAIPKAVFTNLAGIATGDIQRWWDESDARNAPVDAAAEKSARGKYGDDMVELIRQEQKGHSLVEWRNYMIASGQTDEAEQLDTVMRSPEFADARKEMGQALVSPGRQVARALGIGDNHEAFTVVSGLTDGAYRVLTDPLMNAGMGLKAYKVAKYGLPKDTAVLDKSIDRLFDPTRAGGENTRRYFDQAGVHLETLRTADRGSAAIGEARQALSRNFKELNPTMTELMLKHGVKDADTAHEFMKGSVGFTALTKGEAAFRRPLMPYRTKIGAFVQQAKPGSVIDWLEKGHVITADDMADLTAKATGGDVMAAKELGKAFRADAKTFRGRSATAMRRMSTKIPELGQAGHGFDVMADGSSEQIERMARMFGPKDWSKQISGAFMAADEAGRKSMTVGLYLTMFESAGVGKTAAGAQWLRDFRKLMTGEGDKSIYGVTGTSVLDGTGRPVTWRLEDARSHMPVPAFQEMYAQAAKLGVSDRMFGGVNRPWVDHYTTNIWKPSVLIRPALALRNAGEEIVNAMLRNPAGYLNDHASRIVLNRAAGSTTFDPQAARMFRVATWASKGLTKPLIKTNQKHLVALGRSLEKAPVTAHEFYRQRAYGYLSEKYLKAVHPDHLRYIDELATDPWMQSQYRLHILEESTRGASGAAGQDILELTRGGKVGKYRYTSLNGHDLVSTSDDVGAHSWAHEALKTADDPAGLQALLHIDDGTAALAAITRVIEENPEYARRMVKVNEDGAESLAKVVYAETRALMSGADGQLIEPLIAAYRQTGADGVRFVDHEMLTPKVLDMVPNELRPKVVLGDKNRVLVEDQPNLIQRVVQGSFKELGSFTAYLSRQSQFTGAYIEGRQLLQPAEAALKAEFERAFSEKAGNGATVLTKEMSDRAGMLASEQVKKDALDIAIQKTVKYMDNPAVRSQMSVLLRNVAPFYRAQEEFLARWARTFKYSPEAFERGLLMLNGVTESGIVHKDDQGRYLFTYPATGALQKAISKMPFMEMAMLPVANNLTGNLMMMTPGTNIDSQLHPLNGPVLTIPVAAARQALGNKPAFVGVERTLFGESGAGRNVFLQQVPSAIRPIVEAMANSDELISQTAIQSFAMLEATGHGLKHVVTEDQARAWAQANPGATKEMAADWLTRAASAANSTPEEQQAYLERLRMHGKSFMWMKAILKPFLPAAPSQEAPAPLANPSAQAEGLRTVKDEFRSLLKDMSPDKAFEYWTQIHPDEMPFTVGTTDPTGAAPIPATAIAGEFISGNRAFLDKYRDAGVFLIPQGRGEFDEEAWRTAMDMGLREKKELAPYMQDVIISGGLKMYFDSKDKYEEQLAAADDAGDTSTKRALTESWSKWRDEFYSWNPLVNNFLAAGGPRQQERKDTLDQMRRMVSDPDAPDVPGLEKLRTMVSSYDNFDAQISAVQGTDDRTQAYKQKLRDSFEGWMKGYVAGDPGAEMMYNKLFRYMNG